VAVAEEALGRRASPGFNRGMLGKARAD
jgi:hypothetical protein